MTVLKREFPLMILNWLMYHLYLKKKIVLKKKIIDRLVFERILYKQIDTFMTTKFSPHLCGFRKNNNAQYSLLKMIETWRKHLDKGEKIGVILMDLSKTFDTINHSLLLAKLDAYGFSRMSLKLMQN